MINDKLCKCLFIPLIGLLIPFGAGLIHLSSLTIIEVVFSIVFFVFVSHITWLGTVQIVSFYRGYKRFKDRFAQKLAVLILSSILFSASVAVMAAGLWQFIVLNDLNLVRILSYAGIAAIVATMITVIYEAVFLNAEVSLDERVMLQLEQERLQAQGSILQNELDPHFLFNSLNALSYLVQNDQQKAYQFVHKLSNVFKYLLLNKQKDFVSLEEELCFLEDYYFLLQVRFDDSIQIEKVMDENAGQARVLPCTLQALVENAIKHNFFSDNEPLIISINMNLQYVTVANTIRPKRCTANSTKTGLDNLKDRYELLMHKKIIVQKTNDQFLVKVPVTTIAA